MAATAGPRLYLPRAPLSRHIEYFGYWERADGGSHRSRALPRGAITVVIDISARQRVDFFASDGRTRVPVPSAFVAGAGTASYVTQIDPVQAVLTIHFLPGGARPYLGAAIAEVENSCAGLPEFWGREGMELHERLLETSSASARIAILEAFLVQRGRRAGSRHRALTAVLTAVERRPSIPVRELCELTGLPPRSLIGMFRAEVGLSPKAYARVRRFQAALRAMDSGPAGGARIAADLGYFDQSHLVREFRSLAAITPAQYFGRRIELPSHVGLEAQKSNTPPGDAVTMAP